MTTAMTTITTTSHGPGWWRGSGTRCPKSSAGIPMMPPTRSTTPSRPTPRAAARYCISLVVWRVTAADPGGAWSCCRGSVALLGDTLHNVADALTAVPLLIAFRLARRPPTKRYTYGYGRAEDLAGSS